MESNTVSFSVDLANKILATLGTLPFNSVNGLMAEIQKELSAGDKQVMQAPEEK